METENTVEKINKSVAIQYEEAKKEKEFDFDAAFSEENFKMTPLSILMLRTINWEDRIKDSVSGWATNPLYLLSATKLPTKKQIITVGFGSIEYEDVLFQLSQTPRLCSKIRIEAENIEQLQNFIPAAGYQSAFTYRHLSIFLHEPQSDTLTSLCHSH